MNVSYDWLREFVPLEETPEQLRDLITSRTATVDDVVDRSATDRGEPRGQPRRARSDRDAANDDAHVAARERRLVDTNADVAGARLVIGP